MHLGNISPGLENIYNAVSIFHYALRILSMILEIFLQGVKILSMTSEIYPQWVLELDKYIQCMIF